jgi:phage tail tape-measure protein
MVVGEALGRTVEGTTVGAAEGTFVVGIAVGEALGRTVEGTTVGAAEGE